MSESLLRVVALTCFGSMIAWLVAAHVVEKFRKAAATVDWLIDAPECCEDCAKFRADWDEIAKLEKKWAES